MLNLKNKIHHLNNALIIIIVIDSILKTIAYFSQKNFNNIVYLKNNFIFLSKVFDSGNKIYIICIHTRGIQNKYLTCISLISKYL